MSSPIPHNPNQGGTMPSAKEPAGAQQIAGGKTLPGRPEDKRWMRLVVLGLVALVTVGVLTTGFAWAFYRLQHTVVNHATVKGRVYQIGSRLDGQVETVEVEPGQQVIKGQ